MDSKKRGLLCPKCKGTGIICVVLSGADEWVQDKICPACLGTGLKTLDHLSWPTDNIWELESESSLESSLESQSQKTVDLSACETSYQEFDKTIRVLVPNSTTVLTLDSKQTTGLEKRAIRLDLERGSEMIQIYAKPSPRISSTFFQDMDSISSMTFRNEDQTSSLVIVQSSI